MDNEPGILAGDLAALVGGSIFGDPQVRITEIADVHEPALGALVFAETREFAAAALNSSAGAVLLSHELVNENVQKPVQIAVASVRAALLPVLEALSPPSLPRTGISKQAYVSESARLADNVYVAPFAVIEANAVLEEGVQIGAGVYVGEGCQIGRQSILHAHAVLYAGTRVGRFCILHAGCVLGTDGFGYEPGPQGLRKVPHLGRVEVADRVEIGAHTCIDRAKVGVTRIELGTKLDNLVHIGHNVHVGAHCVVAAQTGVAGTVEIGQGVMLAGQAGIKDHVRIGDGARVAAQAGVIGDVAPGETVSGYPARPHRQKMREHAAAAELPNALKKLRALEKKVLELENLLMQKESR